MEESLFGDFDIHTASLTSMLINFNQNLPAVTSMVMALCYIIGFWLFFKGLYKLKQYGDLRTMMSSNTDLREPLLVFMVGAIFLYIPTSINLLEATFFSNYQATAIGYGQTSAINQWQIIQGVVLEIVRLVGLIAFIKGWLIISNLGGHSAGQDTLGKGVTFIVGGVLAMNIRGFIHVLASTFGIPSTL